MFSSKGTKMALNTRFLDEFGVKYLTGSDNDTCAYDTLWPWCGRTLPRSGVNNHQDGQLVNSHRSTNEKYEKSHIDPKICVFVTDLFLWFIMVHHGSSWFIMVHLVISVSLDWFGGLAQHFSSEIHESMCLDTPHARPRAVLDFTKTYGTFLSSQTKGLSFTKVDTWFQVGCFFDVFVGGIIQEAWNGLANPRKPNP